MFGSWNKTFGVPVPLRKFWQFRCCYNSVSLFNLECWTDIVQVKQNMSHFISLALPLLCTFDHFCLALKWIFKKLTPCFFTPSPGTSPSNKRLNKPWPFLAWNLGHFYPHLPRENVCMNNKWPDTKCKGGKREWGELKVSAMLLGSALINSKQAFPRFWR